MGLLVIAPDIVGGVDHAPREDIHATGKEHPQVAPEHEDLELLVPVTQQDHRRRRLGRCRRSARLAIGPGPRHQFGTWSWGLLIGVRHRRERRCHTAHMSFTTDELAYATELVGRWIPP